MEEVAIGNMILPIPQHQEVTLEAKPLKLLFLLMELLMDLLFLMEQVAQTSSSLQLTLLA